MPNWVFNSVVVSGDKLELDKLQSQLNSPITKNYPESKYNHDTQKWEHTPAVQVYSNPVFSFWNVVAPTNLEAYYGEEKEKVGLDNFMQDFNNALANDESWYWWNLRNWGTKWDIAVEDGVQYSNTCLEVVDDESIMYRFETAWSPVEEIFDILSEQYPTLEFDYEFEEEQGWGGAISYSNGVKTITDQYDIPSSHADYVARDREDSCNCEHEDNKEYWFVDCPREVVEV